ncbi:universal stress protein [Actinomadura sp. 7K534]|uniref:universal stress protein n=1 Tax=Actinomadura sp. 7K534 TaxID=2530366 RepID=UPI0010458C77|nr:universal stress protein [Actinomadura sp. 7K534]TDB95511.1 universal stress protein [Actinomadura sp. 7K534]
MSAEPVTGVAVGYDGSREAIRAVDWAAAEARARGTPLTVVHVWEIYIGNPVAMPMVDLGEVAQQTLDGGVAHVHKTAPGLEVRGVLGRGQAAAALIDAGRTADLLVLGPRGIGGFAGLVLGSVSAQVVAHASCPVVIVRGDPEPPPEDGPGRVVVGVDGSPASRAALAAAFAEAGLHGLSVHAVVAWESVPVDDLPPLADEAGMRQAAEARLARMMDALRDSHPGVEVRAEVVHGAPREVLTQAADGARLLVVGSRGLGGFRGLMLGSVGQALVQHAPCPVAVVHAPDDDTGD